MKPGINVWRASRLLAHAFVCFSLVAQAGVGGGMKAGINIWRALRDIKDVHPAWACVAEQRYTEADLPRPITRKEDVGTLTGTKEDDERQVRR
jgi:hypothetical protein